MRVARRPRRGAAGARHVAVAVRRRAPPLALHPHRPRGAAARADASTPAEQGAAARCDRALPGGLRHRLHDHGAGERARRRRGPAAGPGRRAPPGPRPVLPAGVRGAGRCRVLVVALRRPSRVSAPSGRRRRGRGQHAVLLGANPASSPLLGPHPLRPLAAVEDLARELARSLDEEQAARALLPRWRLPTS